MGKAKSKLIAVLDIGSTKVVCIIARLSLDGGVEVLGVGHHSSQGVRAGIVTDIRAAENAILAAVHGAEQMAEVNVEDVVLNVSGNKVRSHHVTVDVGVQGREITDADVDHIVQQGYGKFDQELYEVVHCIPIDYILDGESGIKDPRGMFGHVLQASLHVITTTTTSLLNLANCLARCHLNIAECVVGAYASGLACLSKDEQELGTVVVDMGGGHTTIGVFYGGHIIHTDMVNVGGVHITGDIAWGLSTNLVHAERIKTMYGNVLHSASDSQQMVDVPQMGGVDDGEGEVRRVSRVQLGDILRPRVEETLELIRRQLDQSGYGTISAGRLVLTGGAAQLSGVKELASHVFGKHVRVGKPVALSGLPESMGGGAFSTAIGMLQYFVLKSEQFVPEIPASHIKSSPVGRVVGWLKDNF